jgi:hypothetical protein
MNATTPRTKLSKADYEARRNARRPSFDVTCTIGTVYLDGDGPNTPLEAAMLLIAQHGAPGTFHFPSEQGTTTVTVSHDLQEG